MKRQTRLFTRDFTFAMFASVSTVFMNWFFNVTRGPFIEELTGGVTYVGYIVTIFSLTALAMRFIAGRLSDSIGKVKIMTAGAAVCAIVCAMCGILDFRGNLFLFLILQGVLGIGFGAQSTCSSAIVPDLIPRERMAEGIGVSGIGGTLAQAIGPTIALFIIGSRSMASFSNLFYITAAICGIGLVCGLFVRYERNKTAKTPELPFAQIPETDEPDGRTVFGFDVTLFAPAGMMILYHFGTASVTILLSSFAGSRGFNLGSLGIYYFVNSAGVFLSRILFGKIADRRGCDIVVIPSLAVIAALLFLIPLTGSVEFLISLGLPMGLAAGASQPAINALMFRRASPKRRGAVSALFFAAIDIAFTLAALLFAPIADNVGYHMVFWLAAGFMGLAFLAYVFVVSDRRFAKRQAKRREYLMKN